MPSRFTLLVLAGLLAVGPLSGCGEPPADPGVIVATGHVEATEIRVSAEVAGLLRRFDVREGDRVATGTVLSEQDTESSTLALAVSRAERAAAGADLALREAGARLEDVSGARAQLRRGETDLASAEADLARLERLLARRSVPEKLRDDARTRRDLALRSVDVATAALRKLEVGSRKEEIDFTRARLAAADARIAQIDKQIADARIVCQRAGVVTEKLSEAGEFLQPGSGLCEITDLEDAWLLAFVSEPDIARIRLGETAEVVTDDGTARAGRIVYIASRAEFTPKNVQTREERVKLVYRIKIALDNRDGLYKPGMPAEARIREVPSR